MTKSKPHGNERLQALRKGLLGVKKGVDRKLDEVSEHAYEEACEENELRDIDFDELRFNK